MTPRLAAACFIQTMASKAKELYGSTLLSPPLLPSLPSTARCNGTKSQACTVVTPTKHVGPAGRGSWLGGKGEGVSEGQGEYPRARLQGRQAGEAVITKSAANNASQPSNHSSKPSCAMYESIAC